MYSNVRMQNPFSKYVQVGSSVSTIHGTQVNTGTCGSKPIRINVKHLPFKVTLKQRDIFIYPSTVNDGAGLRGGP